MLALAGNMARHPGRWPRLSAGLGAFQLGLALTLSDA
jgi:hypothetical protein